MRMNKKVKVVLVGGLLVISLGSMVGCSSNKSSDLAYSEIDASKTEEMVSEKKKTLVIDVRDTERYANGHLADAINIPFDEFESRMDELNGYEDQNIVLICNTGNKSAKAAQMLTDKGYKNVYNAADGMDEHDYKKVKYTNVAGAEFEKLVADKKDAIILDVRDTKDYENSHIENAINIPIDELEAKYKDLDKNKEVLIYCSTGNKSSNAAEILNKNGYEKVYNSVDGVKEFEFNLVK